MNETAATGRVMYTDEGEVGFESTSAIFVWQALRNFAMADFEEILKRWWGRLEKRRVATESGGDVTGGPGCPGGPGDDTADKTAATAGDE